MPSPLPLLKLVMAATRDCKFHELSAPPPGQISGSATVLGKNDIGIVGKHFKIGGLGCPINVH